MTNDRPTRSGGWGDPRDRVVFSYDADELCTCGHRFSDHTEAGVCLSNDLDDHDEPCACSSFHHKLTEDQARELARLIRKAHARTQAKHEQQDGQ